MSAIRRFVGGPRLGDLGRIRPRQKSSWMLPACLAGVLLVLGDLPATARGQVTTPKTGRVFTWCASSGKATTGSMTWRSAPTVQSRTIYRGYSTAAMNRIQPPPVTRQSTPLAGAYYQGQPSGRARTPELQISSQPGNPNQSVTKTQRYPALTQPYQGPSSGPIRPFVPPTPSQPVPPTGPIPAQPGNPYQQAPTTQQSAASSQPYYQGHSSGAARSIEMPIPAQPANPYQQAPTTQQSAASSQPYYQGRSSGAARSIEMPIPAQPANPYQQAPTTQQSAASSQPYYQGQSRGSGQPDLQIPSQLAGSDPPRAAVSMGIPAGSTIPYQAPQITCVLDRSHFCTFYYAFPVRSGTRCHCAQFWASHNKWPVKCCSNDYYGTAL
jgi:hypothetical protein